VTSWYSSLWRMTSSIKVLGTPGVQIFSRAFLSRLFSQD